MLKFIKLKMSKRTETTTNKSQKKTFSTISIKFAWHKTGNYNMHDELIKLYNNAILTPSVLRILDFSQDK